MRPEAIAALEAIVGPAHVLVGDEATAGHTRDWTGRFGAPPAAVVRPGRADEVAAVLAVCRTEGVPIVPQGGNTGLVGGSAPVGGDVVVSLRRLDEIRDIDTERGRLTAGAGATIAAVQAAAQAVGWDYGADWAARDSATVGGSIATDAGGIHVIRHGSTRAQVVGVEAVLGSGRWVRDLGRLDKDATGVDLSALLCGSEGTLGIITAARLRLVRRPDSVVLAAVGVGSWSAAEALAAWVRRRVATVSAMEAFGAAEAALVRSHLGIGLPWDEPPPVTVLIECAADDDPTDQLGAALAAAPQAQLSVVATDRPRRLGLWAPRERLPEAIALEGLAHKLDVAVPPGFVEDLVRRAAAAVERTAPGARLHVFGHIAEGNLHLNVTGAGDRGDAVDGAVLEEVLALGGTVSAEHGVGRAKRDWLARQRGDDALAIMRSIKGALDPDGILNPGVLL